MRREKREEKDGEGLRPPPSLSRLVSNMLFISSDYERFIFFQGFVSVFSV